MSVITMKDGRVLNGIIRERTDRTLALQTMTELTTIERAEIQSQSESAQSLMPEGLLATMNESEVRDLVGYLASPGQVPMFATADNIGTFFDGKDLSGWEGNLEEMRRTRDLEW